MFLDQQTRIDLQLLDELSDSVFGCFNHTETHGGEDALRELFGKPLANHNELAIRRSNIRFFVEKAVELTFDKTAVDFMDYYLKRPDRPASFSVYGGIRNAMAHFFSPNQTYYTKRRGIAEVLDILAFVTVHCNAYPPGNDTPLLADLRNTLARLSEHPLLAAYITAPEKRMGRYHVEYIDYLLRNKFHQETLNLLDQVYLLDAYQAIAIATRRYGFTFPEFHDEEALQLEGVFHPLLDNPTPNNVSLTSDRRLNFITGANMAGKSTLMKAVGIAVYLAHLGFPVPAVRMQTCLLNGLITTINLADNIGAGYSHFYTEVKRVKLVAERIQQTDRLLVIFDELFRGTNVKDAYEGSLRIVQAFAAINKGFFIISTHIVEAAQALAANQHISFYYLPIDMVDGKPVFDYRLRKGITDDRIGLWILENEGVFALLNNKQ
ncbi:DNA mismatch repair protein [Parapedobacter sp. 2B3]|uniref:MutS-related protein n=1 Tax=Parapedobacter sp. 2B3 TaxID=3342381 RepID=UPI0035B5F88A